MNVDLSSIRGFFGFDEDPILEDPFLVEDGGAVVIGGHPFAPWTAVGFHRAHEVDVERRAGREPFSTPSKQAVVGEDGDLRVEGLAAGEWCAVGRVGEKYRYVQFPVA